MDILYRRGVTALQLLQHYGGPYSDSFQWISAFCDPRYAFIVWPPLIHALSFSTGRALMLVVIITEWSNMVLKWILMGHRPYWWVMENMKPTTPGDTVITQFPLTCETGPGSPSGHSKLQAAIWFVMVHFLVHKVFPKVGLSRIAGALLWPAYVSLIVYVSLSRLYIGAHFPHQCLLGSFVGFSIAYLMVDLDTSKWKRKHYIFLTIFLYVSTMATYYILTFSGVDVMSTIVRARKWCANPAWIHVDTTPFFSMMRFLGFCTGMGLAVTCKQVGQDHKELSTSTRIIAGVSCTIVGKLSENITMPFKETPLLFYTAAFFYNVVLAYVLFALVPFIVVNLVGDAKERNNNTKKRN